MKILVYAGQIAGVLVMMTIKPEWVIPQDDLVKNMALTLGIKLATFDTLPECDLYICCHGKKIIKDTDKWINIHPCLYKYKGAHPVGSLLEDSNDVASVGIHHMTADVDEGEVIVEIFKKIKSKTVDGVYRELYPVYVQAIKEALKKLDVVEHN